MASPASYSSGIIYFELELFNFSGRASSSLRPLRFLLDLYALRLFLGLTICLELMSQRFPKENVAKTRQKVKIA